MSDLTDEEIIATRRLHGFKENINKRIGRVENMGICLKCGKYPFCHEIEENKQKCEKFIKRKLGNEVKYDNSKSR